MCNKIKKNAQSKYNAINNIKRKEESFLMIAS